MKGFIPAITLLFLAYTGCSSETSSTAQSSSTHQLEINTISDEKCSRYFVQSLGGLLTLDPALTQYVNRIAARIGASSIYRNQEFTIAILNQSPPFSFAFPQGQIILSRGLFDLIENEAELAAVLSQKIIASMKRTEIPFEFKHLTLGLLNKSPPFEVKPFIEAMRQPQAVECEIDIQAKELIQLLGYDPKALLTLYQKAKEQNQHSYFPYLIEKMQSLASQMPEMEYSGYVGKEGYEEIVFNLKASTQAYALFDQAMQVYNAREYDLAYELIQKAIDIQNQEGLFYLLKGRCEKHRQKKHEALRSLSKAIELNPSYYYSYFERAKLLQSMQRTDHAKFDFEAAINHLPSPLILYLYGNLLLEMNQDHERYVPNRAE